MTAQESSEKLAPHRTLSSYYGDDAGRSRYLRELFDASAVHYEWVNRFLSFGTGQMYRKEALERNGLTEGMKILDVATGTGGVARAAATIIGAKGRVVGLDASIGMIQESRRQQATPAIQAFAEALPFGSSSFEFLSMGYAMRHLPDLVAGFREYHRVLQTGGRVLILELTPPKNKVGYFFMKFFMNSVAPLVVRWGTGSRKAEEMMDYYWETTAECVPAETILEALRRAGFSSVQRHVQYGTLSEYSGTK